MQQFRIEKKHIISLSLAAGLIIGYWFHATINVSKIENIYAELDEQEDRYLSLLYNYGVVQENYISLKGNYTDITEQYYDLIENTVSTIEHDALLDDYNTLSYQINYLEENVSQLETQIDDLLSKNEELRGKYLLLLSKYYERKVLSWTFMEVQGLTVNLTSAKNDYMTNEDIEGTINIYYINDEPFNGTVKLILWNEYLKIGTISVKLSIYGKTDYVFDNPFFTGPGAYTLGISEIRDSVGYLIVSSSEVIDFIIPVQIYLKQLLP